MSIRIMAMMTMSALINIPAVIVSGTVAADEVSAAAFGVGGIVNSGDTVAVGAVVKKITSVVGRGVGVGLFVGFGVAFTVGVGVAIQPQVKSVGQSGFLQKPW